MFDPTEMFDPAAVNSQIAGVDEAAMERARRNWDSIAKPLHGLGRIEDDIVRIAGLTGNDRVDISKRAVAVMCADNGVVSEGVTQSDQDVTAVVASNMATGDTSVCRMSAKIGADVFPYNLGMVYSAPGTIDVSIAPQTANLAEGPAMTPEQVSRAISTGILAIANLAERGYGIIAIGEMGIGNTTTSSAITSVLLGRSIEDVTGRGSGLSDEGLARKIDAIRRGIEVSKPDPNDALDVLRKLGGFDIAAMTGACIGGALYRVPIVIDGFISAVSALCAARMCPASKVAMIASHVSSEPAMTALLDELGLEPIICADMHLGEGTGAVCAISLLDMGLSVYNEMVTFNETGIDAYVPLGGESQQ